MLVVVQHIEMGWTYVYEGENCIDTFVQTAILEPRFKNATFIAHNSAAFDSQFITRWLDKHGVPFKGIHAPGSTHRYLEISFQNLRFIDSYKFINVPLAKFGKTFGINQEKGDFPHKFSTMENYNYRGALPLCDEDGEDFYDLKNKYKGSG